MHMEVHACMHAYGCDIRKRSGVNPFDTGLMIGMHACMLSQDPGPLTFSSLGLQLGVCVNVPGQW